MSILVYRNSDLAGAAAATLLAAQIIENPHAVLGLDYTPEIRPVYRALTKMTTDGLLDWSDLSVFALYEHVRPLEGQSVSERLNTDLLRMVNITPEHACFPDSDSQNWSISCADYESAIMKAGGLDCVFLSVGEDGSIVFNRGAGELAPVTHVEWGTDGRVITVGMKTVMSARKVVAFITGKNKVDAANRVINGPVTPQFPASYLQLHRGAVFILDEDAAASL